MGKPRLIILVRHAQSEGNKNRAIHQLVPDHRVKLTDEGWKQAEDAGHRLRNLLRPDDTLQVFTSPYRRTRETTEGILRTLTSPSTSDGSPSPWSREEIVVYEEPRLREQDFGNFQPCSAEMERMWRERADYGHFFYRIPNGESAADAYDRVAGFNESLWRQFGEDEFPSVLVLVTHGLMTRVFLMKWYHWSVEYFEDLRNVNHCEFVLMRQNVESGKFILESQLRTWSELKRLRAEEAAAAKNNSIISPSRRNTVSAFLKQPEKSPSIPARKWGGCPGGCDHDHEQKGKKEDGKEARDLNLPPSSAEAEKAEKNEADDHPLGNHEPLLTKSSNTTDGALDSHPKPSNKTLLPTGSIPPYLTQPTTNSTRRPPSGAATPHERPSDDDEDEVNDGYFPAPSDQNPNTKTGRAVLAGAMRKAPERKPTPEDIERWVDESGMGAGRQADALGDGPTLEEGGEEVDGEEEKFWHAEKGWEVEGGSGGREIGRNAVERLVEGDVDGKKVDEEEGDEEEEERGVGGSVY